MNMIYVDPVKGNAVQSPNRLQCRKFWREAKLNNA